MYPYVESGNINNKNSFHLTGMWEGYKQFCSYKLNSVELFYLIYYPKKFLISYEDSEET